VRFNSGAEHALRPRIFLDCEGLKMKPRTILAIVALGCSSPSFAGDEMLAVTPSGQTQMVFLNSDTISAGSKLANTCLNRGLMVVSNNSTEVVCEAKMGVLQGALSQVLIGNSYSTPPRQFLKFNLVQAGQDARVQATSWTETQMAFGQIRRVDHNNDDGHNNMMGFMAIAGADYLSGTSFPNYAFLGVQGTQILQWNEGGKMIYGLVVSEIIGGSNADKMGILVDDRIVKINDRTFKDTEDFMKRLRKPKIGEAISIELRRGGQPVSVEGIAEVRPTVLRDTSPAVANSETQVSSDISKPEISTRLKNLEELKENGLISDQEYDQKRREILADL